MQPHTETKAEKTDKPHVRTGSRLPWRSHCIYDIMSHPNFRQTPKDMRVVATLLLMKNVKMLNNFELHKEVKVYILNVK